MFEIFVLIFFICLVWEFAEVWMKENRWNKVSQSVHDTSFQTEAASPQINQL